MIVEHSDDFTLRLIEQLADRPGMRLQIYAPNAPDAASLGHPAATPAQAVDNADALIICNRDSKVPVPIPAEAADLSKKIVMDLQGIYDSEQLKDQGFQYVNLTLIDREAQEAARTMWLIGVSLLVSGMGIANALLMSVTERFREIGTLKCLGARDGLVVELFIIESAALGLVGSIFGAVVGLLVAIVGNIATYGWATVKANLPWGDLIKFGLFSLVVGLVVAMAAAIYPAFVAARMTPADALRSDM
jgi:ABC-type lipoprotein release transport system permease subunit